MNSPSEGRNVAFRQTARDWALRLTSWPSVSRTPDEQAFSDHLVDALAETIPTADVRRLSIADGDARASVLAHVAGVGRRAVLLCGHFDTVPTDDYGALMRLACRPEALREAMLAQSTIPDHVRADLSSGGFLPGRGLLDMKAGLAAGIEVLEGFAAQDDAPGHLFLLATPDEEVDSLGIRSAISQVRSHCKAEALDLILAINLDALTDRDSGEAGRVVAFGAIGKIALSALVVGVETHACYPFDGVSAPFIAAAIARDLEAHPALAEGADGDYAAPATLLCARDLKPIYNVTTPARSWLVWNVIQQERSLAETMRIATDLVCRSVADASNLIRERGAAQPVPTLPTNAWSDVSVISFDRLLEEAQARNAGLAAEIDETVRKASDDPFMDTPTLCRLVTENVLAASGRAGPLVVLGLASTPYLATHFEDSSSAGALRDRLAAAVERIGTASGVSIVMTDHLPIISDMSFLGSVDEADAVTVSKLTPVWGRTITSDNLRSLGVPAVNAGPWGRDYHHPHERVHEDYAFRVLPKLVRELTYAALGG